MTLPIVRKLLAQTNLAALLLLLMLFLLTSPVTAQLSASFKADKTGGCSPLTVSFTNTTTGASAAATYSWDFGNGKSSTLINPGSTYIDEVTYTVTLTVKDGSKTSSQSLAITVYKRPVVDFAVSPAQVCIPSPVSFSSKSTAGDGTITNYFWDFGDGATQQGSALGQVNHIYNFPQTASVSLTVTNSYTCYKTLPKTAVTIYQGVTAAFSANNTFLCQLTDPVSFINNSKGSGTLTYDWDFGDGAHSSDPNPSHIYNQKGIYTVQLTVTGPGGCQDISKLVNYINAADFSTDFTPPATICNGNPATFTDNSTPKANYGLWSFDDGSSVYTYGGAPATKTFYSPGQHTVTLTNTYGNCPQTVSKTVKVLTGPDLTGFLINMNGSCGSPVTVNFKDTTTAARKWNWNFNTGIYNGPGSALQAPSYTYTADGQYYVQLTVTDGAGCSSNISRPVNIFKPLVSVYYKNSSSASGNTSCADLSMVFTSSISYDVIKTYIWDFGDGGSSTDAEPFHHFTTPGTYIIRLNYVTQNGCTGEAEYSSVHLYKMPVADFTVLPGTTICGDNPVYFIDKSQGPISNWQWNFGDNLYNNSYGSSPTYQYADSGTYTITLTVNNDICTNTMVKKAWLKVLPPFPKISGALNTCDGLRGLVTFSQTSKIATGWAWDFGDGSSPLSLPADQPSVQHNYNKTGVYKVVLTATYKQCAVRDSIVINVLLKQAPKLSSGTQTICASDNLNVLINNLEKNPFPTQWYYYSYDLSAWQYKYKSPWSGSFSPGGIPVGGNTYAGILQGLTNGKDSIRAILNSDGFGCPDTTNYIPINIKGPIARFLVTANNVCFKSPILLQDNSQANNSIPIKTWAWNFGDNQTQTYNNSGPFQHLYANPGYYYPTLTVTDADGCFASTYYNYAMVQVNGPKAGFSYYPTDVSPNTTIWFNNNTNNTGSFNTQYQWSFGDGGNSVYFNPSWIYAAVGTDTVKLIVSNSATQCADTAIQVLHVNTVHSAFTLTTSYINNNNCPPVVVRFVNTSVNANSVSWKFGDGNTADNQNYPSHTYYTPGVYLITLYAYGDHGAIDSTTDSLTIKGPYAILKADILSGCTGQQVTLSAAVKNASSFTWDFADGTLDQTRDTFAIHQYLTGGLYTPALILKDASGCSATSTLTDTVIIDTLHIGINNMPPHACISKLVLLDPSVISLAADQLHDPLYYKWDFGTGNPADTSNSNVGSFTYPRPGKYPITLRVTSPFGCTKQITNTLLIAEPQPFKLQVAAQTYGCPNLPLSLHAAGAVSYNWINATGLDSSQSANPMANPPLQSSYTVVGYDQYQCFEDTATIPVLMTPSPTVSTGAQRSIEVLTGSTLTLEATGSNDVISWNWSPADYLNCMDCISPVCTPRSSISYIVTGKTQYGCPASDTITLKLICDEGRVYIPNGITPNGAGKNGVFYIMGRGIHIIKYLRIYNRWGAVIFERNNFNIDDRSTGWDGTFKGHPVEPGTYVYITEMICDSGETFPLKGTIMVIR